MPLHVKICGLTTEDALAATIDGGAAMAGFVFYPRSPRHLADLGHAAALCRQAQNRIKRVGLFVDPEDSQIESVLSRVTLDLIQLHGAESPQRCKQLRHRFGLPLIKAFPVAEVRDLAAAPSFSDVVDYFLFDARPPQGALPGGNAMRFDWSLLKGKTFARPWLLAGGLHADNLHEAVRNTDSIWVDVSSGVEDRPGHKSPALIRHFLSRSREV